MSTEPTVNLTFENGVIYLHNGSDETIERVRVNYFFENREKAGMSDSVFQILPDDTVLLSPPARYKKRDLTVEVEYRRRLTLLVEKETNV